MGRNDIGMGRNDTGMDRNDTGINRKEPEWTGNELELGRLIKNREFKRFRSALGS